MAKLQDLPPELLRLVVAYAPNNALLSLIYTCHCLRIAAIPWFYGSVFWSSSDNLHLRAPGLFPDRHMISRACASQIFYLTGFINTLKSSEYLRSCVKNVDLRWKAEGLVPVMLHECLDVLTQSQLQSLHLSPPSFSFDILSTPATTSVAFHECGDRHRMGSDRLQAVLSVPSLTHLHLQGEHHFYRNRGPFPYDVSRAQSSNLVSITCVNAVSNSFHRGLYLWPQCLKSLRIFTCKRSPQPRHLMGQDLHLTRIFLRHQHTLEYLEFGGCYNFESE